MKKLGGLVLLFFVFLPALAQEHAWVYFSDKPNVSEALQNPHTILSQRAIDRKKRHDIAIDESDIPVNSDYINTIKAQPGIEVKAVSKWMNCLHVIGEEEAIRELENFDFVSSIQYANRSLHTKPAKNIGNLQLHNKFEVPVEYDYGETYSQITMLNLDKLHKNGYTGQGMLIAVLDSGFPEVDELPAFQYLREHNGIAGGYDFVSNSTYYTDSDISSHGTRVLSTMAGFIENEYIGSAIDANYYLFRTEDSSSETPVEESYWVEAAEKADSLGVDIINSSLGYNEYDNPNYSYTPNDMDGTTAFVTRGANIAIDKGIFVVTSAGNSGNQSSFPIIGAPADGRAFAVGAVTANETYASFSSTGPSADNRVKPDVVAQGSSASIINTTNNIVSGSGTSFSSPIMAGAVACLWQADPEITNKTLMQYIRESASLYQNPTHEMGYGIPDFETALNNLPFMQALDSEALIVYPNPVKDYLYLRKKSAKTVTFKLYDSSGKLILKKDAVATLIDISSITPGIYLATFENDIIQKTIKIIKH